MDPDQVWPSKTDDELLAAAQNLADYTEEAERTIRAELSRRDLPDPPLPIGQCGRCGRAVYVTASRRECANCGWPFDKALLEQLPPVETVQASENANPPKRLGGWLILVAIGLVFNGIVWVAAVIVGVSMLSDVSDAPLDRLFVTMLVVQAGLLAFLIVAAIQFFRRHRQAPALMIALLGIRVVTYGFLAMMARSAGGEGIPDLAARNFLVAMVSAGIWIPYFRVSKRVKATFVQ